MKIGLDNENESCQSKQVKLSNPQHPIFDGSDFHCSPLHAIDSLETMRACLSFLTTRPGDTDKEYFENYTEAQMEFANSSDCEQLQMYAMKSEPISFDYDDCDLS